MVDPFLKMVKAAMEVMRPCPLAALELFKSITYYSDILAGQSNNENKIDDSRNSFVRLVLKANK